MEDMEETAEMEEMAEKDGGPVVTETATGLTLVLLLLLLLVLPVVMIAAATTTAAATTATTEVPEGKPYTIPPLDAPTWTAP